MGYYSRISGSYNRLHGEEQRKKVELIKKNVKIPKRWRLLDVGCGTGISSDFDCDVIGIDPSAGMLKKNKKPCILGFAEKLPFDDRIFDCVVCLTAIHNFKNAKKGLEEIDRVGRNLFVLSVLKKSRKREAIERAIRDLFIVRDVIDEGKDIIFICRKEYK